MNRDEFNTHISEQMNRNIEALFNEVLEMGGLVEQQLADLNRALENNDIELAKAAMLQDENINRGEMEIDRLCATVLARQQPTASDLRLIVMAIRIAMDLERMGDEAVKIAKMAMEQCTLGGDCSSMPAYTHLRQLMAASSQMIKTALNGFSRLDTTDVMSIYHEEERMDEVLHQAVEAIKAELLASDTADKVDLQLRMLMAVRAAERITDHALNIGESVAYLVKGQDVRDLDEETMARILSQE
ncbi:phosphate signaling complex protein PhoU [Thiomicrorhabdus xiamenensis]|uniref:Phosphate-specific transport system accessory protein PhoU n=1 Tax=Thiomicrorhabdus xiamenensis TaxID=2739063 RepID=A0A7D4SSQ4_9GAMM|nr:phosphate signaling complex protein PhoU [Thiomicrorhabdus xiamenensis]QKI89703.1 phosphate signaling complex protein PhoU [Thiomicrorhabdus xiamenensis]